MHLFPSRAGTDVPAPLPEARRRGPGTPGDCCRVGAVARAGDADQPECAGKDASLYERQRGRTGGRTGAMCAGASVLGKTMMSNVEIGKLLDSLREQADAVPAPE